jgi:thymidylate synthase
MLIRYNDLFVKESDEILVENYKESIPSLLINDEKTDFYEMTIEDFFMVNYNPIKPQLKLELGI